MLVMNNFMYITAKDNANKRKDYPLFPLWSMTEDGTRGMVITLSKYTSQTYAHHIFLSGILLMF